MGLHNSYFAIGNPLEWIDRRLNPYRHHGAALFDGQPIQVAWTERAERALLRRAVPLMVEMQIYFACVVKKRVLFHERSELDSFEVNKRLWLSFHAVEASSCDPVEFAAHYPERRELQSPAARRMRPRQLRLDHRRGVWQGEFDI